MNRYHLFEWEDQPWLPAVLRDYLTDHLRFALGSRAMRPLHEAIASILLPAMAQLETREIIDLCSGAGGPLIAVQRHLQERRKFETTVTLTDLYPNIAAFEQAQLSSKTDIRICREPVNVFDVPMQLKGIRTMFTAFHHFRPDDARRILLDASQKRCGIAIFEPFARSFRVASLLGVSGLIASFLQTPKIGRMSLQRIVLTYVLPVAPAVVAWDGFVSGLRSYTVDELRDLAASVGGQDFTWQAGYVPYATLAGPMHLTYLVGLPT